MRRIGWLLLLLLVTAPHFTEAAVVLSERDWQTLKRQARSTGAVFPAGPVLHDLFLLTNDSSTGACDPTGGVGVVTLCRWNGSQWVLLTGSAAARIVSGESLPAEPCTVNSIYSLENAGESGASVVYFCADGSWEQMSQEVDTLNTVFNRGNVITGAIPATPLIVGDGVTSLCTYTDPTSGIVQKPCVDSDTRRNILDGYTDGWFDVEGDADMFVVDPDAATKKAMYAFQPGYYPLKSAWIGAGSLYGDGTNCPERPTAVTINSGPKIPTFICADNNGSRLTGMVRMPNDWDGGTITLTHVYIQTAADTNALNGDVAAQCRGAAETVSSTWGTEVPIDDAAVTGSNTNDLTTSAAVTPAGTCAAGDMVYFYWEMDATGTTTATATLHHLGFHLTYSSTSLSH